MTTTLLGISYDAEDAATAATFWAAALGREVAPGASDESASIPPSEDPASGPLLMFHKVPEGKTTKNRLHLDLITANFDEELSRLQQLGATTVATFEAWTTLQDPEGNEFDLIHG
jgi:Glyoxalase-like domain